MARTAAVKLLLVIGQKHKDGESAIENGGVQNIYEHLDAVGDPCMFYYGRVHIDTRPKSGSKRRNPP